MRVVMFVLLTLSAAAAPPNVSVRAVATDPVVYVGQQVILGWFLDSTSRIDSFEIVREPVVGRVVMPLGKFRSEATQSLRRYALFPEEPGTIEIAPVTVLARVDEELINVSSAPLAVRVLPLPKGANAAAVGSFSLDCSSMKNSNGAITFDVTVRGTGSFFDVVRPRADGTPDFVVEIVSAGEVTTERRSSPVERSQKWTVRIPGVPKPRIVTTPDIVLDYFDPKTAKMSESRCRGREVELPPAR